MPRQHPNLIFLFADQLNYQSCGFSGETRAHTPNLDRLAAEGVNFSQAVSCCPLCGPYRASLLTGKYPSSTGQYRNDVRCMPDDEAIGHQLERAGYRTGYIGKWHLYCRTGDEQFTPPGPYRLGFDQYFASYNWNHDYWNGFYYPDSDERIPMKGYQTDFQTDMAMEFIETQKKESPFALFVSYEIPHPPCTPDDVPKEYYELFRDVDFSDLLYNQEDVFSEFTPSYDRAWQQEHIIDDHNERCRVYYAMNACLDRNIGRILTYIDQHGLADNTILVFTSDHGDMLGGHGRIQKRIFFEESVRVPLLLRWNTHIPSGVNSEACINTPDIMPTLLELMGLSVPEGYEGDSYAPLLMGNDQPDAPDDAFITNMHYGKFNHHEEYRAIRNAQYLYARMARIGKEFLFDHRHDPKEEKNLAGEKAYQEVLHIFRKKLADKMKALGDEARPHEWYWENWIEEGHIIRSAGRNT